MFASKKMCGDSHEMREMAARICRDYLHGAWKSVTAQNVGFKHISGGLSNWLYHVWLPESLKDKMASSTGPSEVLIRVYGQMHGERAIESLITESVIFTLLSERGLGPRLHGVFPGGRIEEYIAARPLKTKELADRDLSAQIATKMAAIHRMEVPLNKEPRWLWDTMQRWQITSQAKLAEDKVPQHAEFLKEFNFAKELSWLKKIIGLQPSPVVFCHNDFQEGNILMEEENNNQEQPKLVLIDFEYCSYNYRGFDIANHLLEWTYDYTTPEPPYYSEMTTNYPTEMQRLHFIQNYLSETGDSQSPQALLAEIRTYSLASHLFWGLWSIVNAGSSQITFGYWEYASSRLGAYRRLKEELLPNFAQKRKIEETL
ncbi:uncharacterized protein CBL_02202 [Carabus blaptoides fortunei]